MTVAKRSFLAASLWTLGPFRRLRGDPDALVLAVYLRTCEARVETGLYPLSLPTLVHETGVGRVAAPGPALRALEALQRAGDAFYDLAEETVWVPSLGVEQIGARLAVADNRRKYLLAAAETMRASRFYEHFRAAYGSAWAIPGAERAVPPDASPYVEIEVPEEKPLGSPSEAPSKPLRRGAPSKGLANTSEAPSKPLRSPSEGGLYKNSKVSTPSPDVVPERGGPGGRRREDAGADAPALALVGDDGDRSDPPKATPEDLLRTWQENRGGLAEAAPYDPRSRKSAWARLAAEPDLEIHAAAIRRVDASPIPEKTWATFRWYLRPDTLAKILEGTYDRAHLTAAEAARRADARRATIPAAAPRMTAIRSPRECLSDAADSLRHSFERFLSSDDVMDPGRATMALDRLAAILGEVGPGLTWDEADELLGAHFDRAYEAVLEALRPERASALKRAAWDALVSISDRPTRVAAARRATYARIREEFGLPALRPTDLMAEAP